MVLAAGWVLRQVQKFRARNWKEQPFPKWPVDTTVENICERVLSMSIEAKGVDKVPFVWFWPDGANSCVTMTHDVETEAGRDYCPELMNVDDAFGVNRLDTIPGAVAGLRSMMNDGHTALFLLDGNRLFLRAGATCE